MMESRPAPYTQLASIDDVRPYTLSNALEIAQQLRMLANRHEMVSVYFNQGHDFLLTSILSVDPKAAEFTFDPGSDEAVNRRLLASERAVFVAMPEGVKTQFVCGRIGERRTSAGPVLFAALPHDLIKLQRRDYYRVETPVAAPLVCRIQHPLSLALPLHDMSLGGVGLLSAKAHPELEQMSLLTDCRIELPGFGALVFDLEVRNQRPLVLRNGAQQILVGCRFINLDGKMQNLLQRYMIQLERERRALAG